MSTDTQDRSHQTLVDQINWFAEAEGWGIFNRDPLEPEEGEIQSIDEGRCFADDEAAVIHVRQLAEAGSSLHRHALDACGSTLREGRALALQQAAMPVVPHIEGPWRAEPASNTDWLVIDPCGTTARVFGDGDDAAIAKAHALRIVACVNACEGVTSESLAALPVLALHESRDALCRELRNVRMLGATREYNLAQAANADDKTGVRNGPGSGTWSVFAQRVARERDDLAARLHNLEADMQGTIRALDAAVRSRDELQARWISLADALQG